MLGRKDYTLRARGTPPARRSPRSSRTSSTTCCARLTAASCVARGVNECCGGVRRAAGRSVRGRQRARHGEELAGQSAGLRTWFVGDEDAAGSPWRTLDKNVVEAIRALDMAERLGADRLRCWPSSR